MAADFQHKAQVGRQFLVLLCRLCRVPPPSKPASAGLLEGAETPANPHPQAAFGGGTPGISQAKAFRGHEVDKVALDGGCHGHAGAAVQARATRREWLASLARWGGLAALAGLTAWLTGRAGGGAAAAPRGSGLRLTPRCADCGAFLRCTLPEAESARAQGHGLAGPVRGSARPAGPESERSIAAVAPLCSRGDIGG